MTGPPTLADLMADPGELDVSCLDCHHNMTMPVAACCPAMPLKRRFLTSGAASAVRPAGQRIDVRSHRAACQAAGQITPP